MKCPKCISPMIKVRFNGIEVDRCTDCHGLWFDEFEKDDLLKIKGSEKIDIGDAKVGREFDQVNCVFCPRCGTRMVRMAALEQPHIRFEHCTVCAGCFLDAGEFRDLKHHSLIDILKDLFINVGTRRLPPSKLGQEKLKALQFAGSPKQQRRPKLLQKVILI
jgi:uncharacterized protein